jgi:hypothetical protein
MISLIISLFIVGFVTPLPKSSHNRGGVGVIRGEHKALIETFNRYLPLSVQIPLGDGSLDNEVEVFQELLTNSGGEVGLRGESGKAQPFHWTRTTKAQIREKKATKDAYLAADARGNENAADLLREAKDAALRAERLSSRIRKTKEIGHALSRGESKDMPS